MMNRGKRCFPCDGGATHDQWLPVGNVTGIVLLPVFAGMVSIAC